MNKTHKDIETSGKGIKAVIIVAFLFSLAGHFIAFEMPKLLDESRRSAQDGQSTTRPNR